MGEAARDAMMGGMAQSSALTIAHGGVDGGRSHEGDVADNI